MTPAAPRARPDGISFAGGMRPRPGIDGQLVVIDQEVDPYLEAAAIQRRVYQVGGPALFFLRQGDAFPVLGNLFGTLDRTRFLFRDTLESVRRLVELKVIPAASVSIPGDTGAPGRTLWRLLPRRVRPGPILANRTTIDRLPQIQSWPDGRRAFVTLPQVYTEDPDRPGLARSNLGMYRVQLSGNQYEPNREVGLHYQIHRGIGVHHAAAIRAGRAAAGQRLRRRSARPDPRRGHAAAGGPAGAGLRRRPGRPPGRHGHARRRPADARRGRLCDRGSIDPERRKPEGPFGDHLGYYSLKHDFPVLSVDRVYHRDGAIWPFTAVGRPPQEDTSFGAFIHELTGPIIPTVIPGVHAVHAVDAAGVHPLLLAIGSERYVPDARSAPAAGMLTIANAILGQGQLSLAKYLLIVAARRRPAPRHPRHSGFLRHVLERVDWTTDLHFQTRTTIDTLDYSGHGLNQGSKVVIAAAGPRRRDLPAELPPALRLPDGFRRPADRCCRASWRRGTRLPREWHDIAAFCRLFGPDDPIRAFPLDRDRRRQRVHRADREELPLGHVHALQPGRRHRRHRGLHR